MTCGSCGQRKGRRQCPALARDICPACCGSKRLVEIACPEACPWLTSAQQHPAAAVRRQHEADLRELLTFTAGLTEWQFQLFFLIQAALSRFSPEDGRLLDRDVAAAVGTLAATYDAPDRAPVDPEGAATTARRLAAHLRVVLDDLVTRGGQRVEAEVALVLRAVERGAAASPPGSTAYLDLVARVLREGQPAARSAGPRSAAVVPPGVR